MTDALETYYDDLTEEWCVQLDEKTTCVIVGANSTKKMAETIKSALELERLLGECDGLFKQGATIEKGNGMYSIYPRWSPVAQGKSLLEALQAAVRGV